MLHREGFGTAAIKQELSSTPETAILFFNVYSQVVYPLWLNGFWSGSFEAVVRYSESGLRSHVRHSST